MSKIKSPSGSDLLKASLAALRNVDPTVFKN